MEDDETQSKCLLSSEHSESLPAVKQRLISSRTKTYQLILLCVVIEMANLLLVYSVYDGIQRIGSPKLPDLDGLQKLKEQRVLKIFDNDNKWTEDTEFANNFWRNELMPKSAIVSLDAKWAASQGIPPSAPTPGKPNEMVYQPDVIHNLHCLYRIRKQFLSNESDPHNGHILHCLNYLRQAFQCNPDLMLGTTTTYVDYGLDDVHVCRDYDAILQWVDDHKWKEFWDWNRYGSKGTQGGPTLADSENKEAQLR